MEGQGRRRVSERLDCGRKLGNCRIWGLWSMLACGVTWSGWLRTWNELKGWTGLRGQAHEFLGG